MASKSNVGPDGIRVEGLGVCSMTMDSVNCWNMEGVHDSGLSDRLRDSFLSQNDVQIKFGRKNRFLIVRVHGSANAQLGLGADGGYASQGQIYDAEEGRGLSWIRKIADPQEKEASVLVTFWNRVRLESIDIPFKKGAKASYRGSEIEIGPWEALKPPTSGQIQWPQTQVTRSQKQWSIFMGLTRSDLTGSSLSFSALDKDQKSIHYVDKVGKPISDIAYLQSLHGLPDPNRGYAGPRADPKYFPAVFGQTGDSFTESAMVVHTSVNPQYIANLRVQGSLQEKVLITGFPLDPK